MEAYSASRNEVTKLRMKHPVGLMAADMVWPKKLLYRPADRGQVQSTIEALKASLIGKNGKVAKSVPRFLMSTDGDEFLAVDLKSGETPGFDRLSDLPVNYDFLLPMFGVERYQPAPETVADVRAARHMAKFHDAIRDANPDWGDDRVHDLNLFMTRLLFCMFAEDNSLRTKLRRQVRYFKMWAALAFEDVGRPSSILLTVLVTEAAREVDLGLADDEILAALVPIIHKRLSRAYLFENSEVLNPADQGNARENLNRLSDEENKELIAKLETFADIAARATASTDKAAAAEIWAEAFEHFFPLPEDNDEEALEKSAVRNALVLAFDPQVRVVATPKNNAHRSWEGMNGLPPIPKDCTIQFTLLNSPPAGATLRWTVRNRGEEAAMKNDLGHIVGTGLQVERNSAYNGDHAMDLTVMLGKQVIGRRRIAVNIRGIPIPPRNPKRRRRF